MLGRSRCDDSRLRRAPRSGQSTRTRDLQLGARGANENYLVFLFFPLILFLGRYFELSNVSYTLIALFGTLHVIGSHYTYLLVPFGYTLQHRFGAERNMYGWCTSPSASSWPTPCARPSSALPSRGQRNRWLEANWCA
jgi:uncharacterized membrane protein YjdF